MTSLTRRRWLRGAALVGAATASGCAATPAARGRVVVVGGGFAGASCARALAQASPQLSVVLLEPKTRYTACPFSNLVLATSRPLASQQFGYEGVRRAGVDVRHVGAEALDAQAQTVTLDGGSRLGYDRLVLAPGIELDFAGLPGYDAAASERMPHAWQAGPQTLVLKSQLEAMSDGGVVVMAVPDNPYRCPPGPYERASLIAHYLKTRKPRSKLLILDAKDRFSKQPLFRDAWAALYGDLIEWQGRSDGAAVVSVDAASRTLETDFESVRADVANVIPPQRAGGIARRAGVADASGWCPVDPLTFESTLVPGVHVIGDAAIANAMPKSAFAANAQARFCASQLTRLLAGEAPEPTTLINTCYSLVSPDYGISVAGVYRPGASSWEEVPGAGGVSPRSAAPETRTLEAGYARDWYQTITAEVFG